VLYLLAELFNKQTKPKKVINVISSVAIAGRGNHSSYACRMAAFWSFTKSLRRIYGNELLVTEIITSSGKPAGHALASCHADVDFFAAVSRANATAQKIYCAEKNGKEIVFVPMKARFLLVLEALMPRLYSKVYA
jgi:short-subunit dehydrogenase involved in D-alanine esterification of teichoic acids